MRIYGTVRKVEMKKFSAFDPKTGVPDPGYILQATVMDMDDELICHQVSFNAGFGLEALQDARKVKAPEAERDQLADGVLVVARQLEGQQLEFIVGKPRAKGFVSFPVTSTQPMQVDQQVDQ